ncbi:MAG: DUF3303 family protein [Promethearchaeota archaeon]|jgi:hypothetical protein
MKYAIYSKYDPKERDQIMARAKKVTEMIEKNPEKYPKQLFGPHSIGGGTSTIQIVEANEEQLMNSRHAWMPLQELECVPLFDSRKLAELYPETLK